MVNYCANTSPILRSKFHHEQSSLDKVKEPLLSELTSNQIDMNKDRKSNYIEGGLYYKPDENGGYSIIKILKIDNDGYHIRLFSNNFMIPPKSIDEKSLFMAGMNRKPGESMGIGHLPLSRATFIEWNPVFIQKSTVKPDELEGYKMWLDDRGGYL